MHIVDNKIMMVENVLIHQTRFSQIHSSYTNRTHSTTERAATSATVISDPLQSEIDSELSRLRERNHHFSVVVN